MHDCKNHPLKAGDFVLLAFIIAAISEDNGACNLSLEAVGDADYKPLVACNSKLALFASEHRPPGEHPVHDFAFMTGNRIMRELKASQPAEEVPADVAQTKGWRRAVDEIQIAMFTEGKNKPALCINLACEIENNDIRKSLPREIAVARLRQAASESTMGRVIIAITEASMWLGQDLKLLDEANPGISPDPYPESRDPSSAKIEPTADGLKFAGIGNSGLQPHQLRMIGELDELRKRTAALESFIHSNPVFLTLGENERELMQDQFRGMARYHRALSMRVDSFTKPASPEAEDQASLEIAPALDPDENLPSAPAEETQNA